MGNFLLYFAIGSFVSIMLAGVLAIRTALVASLSDDSL